MPSSPPRDPQDEVRCHCGKLLARWEDGGIVIKCARCGQMVMITHRDTEGRPQSR